MCDMLGIDLFYEDSRLEVVQWGSVGEDCSLYNIILRRANILIKLFKGYLENYLYSGVITVVGVENHCASVSVGYGDSVVFEEEYTDAVNTDEWVALESLGENLRELGVGVISVQISILESECYVINIFTKKPEGSNPFAADH